MKKSSFLRTTNTVILFQKHKYKTVNGSGGIAPHLTLGARGQ
jgi:hypothetical protein